MIIKNGSGNPKIEYNIPIVNRLGRKNKSYPMFEKIKTVAKVVFAILLSLVLFWINPSIFFISFVVGIAFSQVLKKAIDKINVFMKHYKWPVLGGCAVLAALALPASIAVSSAVWAAHVGSFLSIKAQEAYQAKKRAAMLAAPIA